MRPYIIALLLMSCLPLNLAGEAKSSLRIERNVSLQQGTYENNKAVVSSSRSNRLPLNGQVEVQEEGSLLDPQQFAGTPKNKLGGNAANLNSNVNDRGELQSGLKDGQIQPGNAGIDQISFAPTRMTARLKGDLTDQELKQLATHDIVVMQDRSSSMSEKEYFPMVSDKMSKWQWCMSQSMDLTRQAARLPKFAFTLVVFSSQYEVFQNVSLPQLPQIIASARNGFFIGTKLAAPMHDQLSQYFQRRAAGRARPLIIAVITDGKPQDEHELEDVIVQATQLMQNPNEIKIRFLQVGNDDEGTRKLHMLDDRLVGNGARYDIVGVETFSQLCAEGLPRALLSAIRG